MGGTTANSEARRHIGGRLSEHIDSLVSAVDGERLYGLGRPVDIGEVARTTTQVVGFVVRALVTQRPLDRRAERFLRRLGRRRVEQGITLDTVTLAFEKATAEGLRVMKDAALAWPEPRLAWDTYAEMAAELFALVHTATGFVRDGYEERVRGVATGRAREGLSLVEDIFEGEWSDAAEMVDRGRANGQALTTQCLLVTAVSLAPAETARLRAAAVELLTSTALPAVVGLARAVPVPHVPLLLPLADGAERDDAMKCLHRWAEGVAAVVVAEMVEDMATVPAVYKDMRDELGLVAAAVRRPGAVDRGRELHVPRLLQVLSHEQVEAFVRPTLGGVLAQPPTTAERLLETLAAVFAWEGSLKRLATGLALSNSGLRTRLGRVLHLTARHYNRDRVELSLALLLFRIHRLRLPAIGDPRWAHD